MELSKLNAPRPPLNVRYPGSGRSINPQSEFRNSKCQGGELNSRPRAYESPALPLSYPGAKFFCTLKRCFLNPATHAADTAASTAFWANRAQTRMLRQLLLRQIRREILLRAAHCSHEKNAVVHLHRAGPSLLLDVTPPLEFFRLSRLRVPGRRK
jgi:hypothetical protein